ncbi:MAG TPA: hypothetical protein VMB81_09670 [Candidatus Sulfotelmatobacter sp.]|nr:hypothetical protein [Candidatus Sulfotelmatobacter sp.]
MADSDSATIVYRFHLAHGVEEIALRFDRATFALQEPIDKPAADWARLDYHQCPNCPLSPRDSPQCPFARGLSGFVERFEIFRSFDEATTEVVTSSRTVMAHKSLQDGMASLVGLIGATSGCPHLAFFRPMARFHLPFARDDETLFRVFSMYLLGRYLRDNALGAGTLEDLRKHTEAATVVNRGMADRIRAAFDRDVLVNAVIILDMFARAVPFAIEEGLLDLRDMFGLPSVETDD